MEVSWVTGNVTQSYHDDDNNQCAQCEEESGQVSPSAGFCETCNDFLCSACIKQHKTFRGTRYHELLEGENMPLKRPTPTDVEQCSVHQDRAVEMYCLDEDILGCTLCFSIGHRMCQNIDLISNLSKDVETSEDMKEVQSASDKQKAFSNQIVEKVHELRSTNDNCHSGCLQDYHSFHSEMLDMLDKLGSKVSKRANKLKKMNDEKLEKLLNMILLYDKQVVSLVENIDKMLDHVNCQRDQLFIALKKSKNQILESVKKSEQLTSELYIELFHFSCDFSIKQLLATNCKFVSFEAEAPVSKGSSYINSNAKQQTYTATCREFITKNNNVGPVPTTASTSKGSIEIDNNVASDTASPSTSNESIEKDNSVGPEPTTAPTSKGSIEIVNNVASDTASTSTSKGSVEKDNNVGTEQTTASTSKGSIEKNNNVSTEPTTALISKGSIEIDSKFASDTASPSTSKGSMENNNNVSPEPTTAPISKGSIKKDNNVSPEPTTAPISKGSIKKNNNVSPEPTTASTSKGSIEKNNSVGTVQTTASTSKGSVKKGNNVGEASTTPPAAEESIVKQTQPGTKCKGNEQKNEHFRQEALANVWEATSLMNIKSPEDTYNCCISGMELISQSELILSDRNNSCLKLIDIDRGKIIKRQHLKSTPWDVSLMPESRVAVSLPDNQEIQIYTADRNLHNCKSLRVAGRCRGLDCSGDAIAVSFIGPTMVQILDLKGNVMKTIQHDSSGKLLFCAPLYLTISLDNKRIYVSDKSKSTITCVDSEQGVCWVYKDKKLELPCGLTLEDNRCLYVCSLNNHTIHVVSPDGVCRAIIPYSQSGVQCPRAVCYSGNEHTLYISSELQNSDQRNCIQKLRLQ